MSTKIAVNIKQLLLRHGVELKPEFNLCIEDALEELSKNDPDEFYVDDCLSVLLIVSIPTVTRMKIVTVERGKLLFNCGDPFLKRLVSYCELFGINYDLVK